MRAGSESPGLQGSADEGPEPCRGEGPVVGFHKIGDTRLRDLAYRRGRLRRCSLSLTGRNFPIAIRLTDNLCCAVILPSR